MLRRIIPTSLLATALLLAGCAADEQDHSRPSAGDDQSFGHIHGLGVDPADNTLYVATHHGLFHVDHSGEPRRVADRWQDTMAFTVAGPGHFLASGHPDLREDLPPHLGLIESTDAGETWQPLALQGDADFHVLEPVGRDLYAYDATSSRLLHTRDKKAFREVAKLDLLDLTGRPEEPNTLIGTTTRGRLIEIAADTGDVRPLSGPALVVLETTADGDVAGIDADGTVMVGGALDGTWERRGEIGGRPTAILISGRDWYAATDDRVFWSVDDGATWTWTL